MNKATNVKQKNAIYITTESKRKNRQKIKKKIVEDKWLYIMLIPGVIYYILFKYGPMFGLSAAFKDYMPFLGFFDSEWVGIKHFSRFFSNPSFFALFRNTLSISLLKLAFFFPAPIFLAILLNEVRVGWFKKSVQTLTYFPHFLSWVVIISISYTLFTTEGGIVNNLISALGFNQINFLASKAWFRPLIIIQNIWKETGWGSIIFLAALSGVNVEMYEAAKIDGASRIKQIWYITLPSIKSTVVTMLILNLGDIMDTNFDQIYLMQNALNKEVSDVFDTYVYRMGLISGQLSYSTAVGMFKSVVGLILVLLADFFAKKIGEEGVL